MGNRLTDDQVAYLRVEYAKGASQTDLADRYGISQNSVSSIVTGRTRLKAGGPIRRRNKRKLTADDVVAIRTALSNGTTAEAISTRYEITQQMVSLLRTGRAFADAGGPVVNPGRRAEPLTVDAVEQIKGRVQAGESRTSVAAAFGISMSTVNSVMTDRLRGRESRSRAGLSTEGILEMRRLYRAGMTQTDIAELFEVTQQTVSQIVRGTLYPTHGGPIARDSRRRLPADEVKAIRHASGAGASVAELAERHHVTQEVIKQVVAGITYSEAPRQHDQ